MLVRRNFFVPLSVKNIIKNTIFRGVKVKGFRRINGANWLKGGRNIIYANNSVAFCSPGNMPPHWGLVREVLLRQCK